MFVLLVGIVSVASADVKENYLDDAGSLLPGVEEYSVHSVKPEARFCGPDGNVIRMYSQSVEVLDHGQTGWRNRTFLSFVPVFDYKTGKALTCFKLK
jgi:hypothetical protein